MKVRTSVTIPDYVYEFYKIGAARLKGKTPEQLMEIALERYAGMVADDLIKAHGEEECRNSQSKAPTFLSIVHSPDP